MVKLAFFPPYKTLFLVFSFLAILYFPTKFLWNFITQEEFYTITTGAPRLVDATESYFEVGYSQIAEPYGFFWNTEKNDFFYKNLTKNNAYGRVSKLAEKKRFFTQGSIWIDLPLKNASRRVVPRQIQSPFSSNLFSTAKYFSTDKKIDANWFPTKDRLRYTPSSKGFSYTLGSSLKKEATHTKGVYYSTLDKKGLLYEVRFLSDMGKDYRISPFKGLIGHFYHPTYWDAENILFYNGITREIKKGISHFVYNIILTGRNFSKAKTWLITTNVNLKPLKIVPNMKGKFFLYSGFDAITLASPTKNQNNTPVIKGAAFNSTTSKLFNFSLEIPQLLRLYSFAMHPKKDALLLVADDISGETQAIFSLAFERQKQSTMPFSFLHGLLLIFCFLIGTISIKVIKELT